MFEEFIKKITNENTDKEIINVLKNDESAKKQIDELIEKIKDGESKENIFAYITTSCQEEKLSQIIINVINSNLKPFEEMSYFRKIKISEFKSLMVYLVNNTLINTESKDIVLKETGLSNDNFTFAIRLLNTINDYVIVRRFTANRFQKILFDMFRFDIEKSEFLWELYNTNKKQLTEVVMLNNISLCRDINNTLSNLLNIFSDISKSSD